MFDEATLSQLADAIAARVAARIAGDGGHKIGARYMTIEQAAEYIGNTPDGVRHLIKMKAFPVKKLGSRIYLDREDIDRALQAATTWAAPVSSRPSKPRP